MITPIIMEESSQEIGRKLAKLREQKIDRVHFDIGDGMFSDLLTVAPADLQQFDFSKMKVDMHLLVDDPSEWIEECSALKPARLIGQIERMGSQTRYIESVTGYGTAAGLGLKIETPVEELEEEALKNCAVVLLLAVPAGTSGSKFDERIIAKIKELKKRYRGKILIDGGINPEVYKRVVAAGASEAGANSWFWSSLRQNPGWQKGELDG